MLGTVRHKVVRNATDAPLTIDRFEYHNDGNDIQYKIVNRIIGAGDIGDGPGQVGHSEGAILDVIRNFDVLFVEVQVYRPLNKTPGGMIPYNNMNNQVYDQLDPQGNILTFEVQFGLALDNTIRILDKRYGTFFRLIENDILFTKIYIGKSESPLGFMNV